MTLYYILLVRRGLVNAYMYNKNELIGKGYELLALVWNQNYRIMFYTYIYYDNSGDNFMKPCAPSEEAILLK